MQNLGVINLKMSQETNPANGIEDYSEIQLGVYWDISDMKHIIIAFIEYIYWVIIYIEYIYYNSIKE